MNCSIFWIELQGATKMFDRVIRIAVLKQRSGQVAVSRRIGWIDFQSTPKMADRPVDISPTDAGDRQIIQGT